MICFNTFHFTYCFFIWNSRLNDICDKSLIYVFLLFKIYYYYFDANANIFSFGVLISGWIFFFFENQLVGNIQFFFSYKFCPIVIQMFIHSCMIVEFTMYMKVSNSYVNIFVYNIWLIIFLCSSLNYTTFSFHVSNKKFCKVEFIQSCVGFIPWQICLYFSN